MTNSAGEPSKPSGNQLLCYNKGCGKQFDPNLNTPESCQFHPGDAVFHDALKGWSCCNKKSTDFTQFLSIPGCTKKPHTNIKPVEVEKIVPVIKEELLASIKKSEAIAYESHKSPEVAPRPTNDEPTVELKRIIAASVLTTLEKLNESFINPPAEQNDQSKETPIGTSCKNMGCQGTYKSEISNGEKCIHHPGEAIFHEGMKFWSCCKLRTSDFNNFLNQAGCAEGNHLWIKQKADTAQQTDCRFDFHQTGGFVSLTVYSKNPVPGKTFIKANSIKLELDILYEAGAKTFTRTFELFGVVNLNESVVNFYQSKVEIKLKKADASSWSRLEYVKK